MIWNSDQYWNKACVYLAKARLPTCEPWERVLWHGLALEFLTRAAASKVHPVLNADPVKDEGANVMYAIGIAIKQQPRTIPIHSVLARLVHVVDDFTPAHRDFCDYFVNMRNQELHTSESALGVLSESKWLGRYYEVCTVLAAFIGSPLDQLIGVAHVANAERMIQALKADMRKAVYTKVASHRSVFEAKGAPEQERLKAAATAANRWVWGSDTQIGCPACSADALLSGEVESQSEPYFANGEFVEDTVYLATKLQCPACGLQLNGLDELAAVDIEPHFTSVQPTDLHELVEHEDEGPDYDNM